MLVLCRKIGQRIYVGDDIIIEIKQSNKYQVHIGIQAPQEMEIHREEVYNRIQAEKSYRLEMLENSRAAVSDSVPTVKVKKPRKRKVAVPA